MNWKTGLALFGIVTVAALVANLVTLKIAATEAGKAVDDIKKQNPVSPLLNLIP